MTTATPDYLNATEAARLLRVRESKVLAWLRSGELPAADVSQNPGTGKARWRIARADLLAFLEGRRPGPAGKATRRKRRDKKPAGWVTYV